MKTTEFRHFFSQPFIVANRTFSNAEPSIDWLTFDDNRTIPVVHDLALLPTISNEHEVAVLGVDEDDFLMQKLLDAKTDAMIKIAIQDILAAFTALQSQFPICGVALCVESLSPGGFDATDGINLAKALEKAGARFLITSGGTAQFPALKYRRKTMQKKERPLVFSFSEPWISSAAWIVPHVSIPVIAQGALHDPTHAKLLAQNLGLKGIIAHSS